MRHEQNQRRQLQSLLRSFTLAELVVVIVVAGALATVGAVAYTEFKDNAYDEAAELVLADTARAGSARATLRSAGAGTLQHGDFTPGDAYTLTAAGAASTRFGEISVAVENPDAARAGLAMVSRSGRCARAVVSDDGVTTSSGALQDGEECSGDATLLVGVAPPAPEVSGEAGVGSATIEWGAVAWPHVSRYVVSRGSMSEIYPHQPGGSYSFTETGLEPGVAVSYTIRAENPYGSADTTVTVTPVGAPGTPEVSGEAGDGGVTLTWVASSTNGSAISSYEIETRTVPAEWAAQGSVGGDETSTAVGDLSNGVSYEFRVRAVNEYGAGSWSTPVALTPTGVPGEVGGLTATAGTGDSAGNAVLSWGEASPQGGLELVSYEMQYSTDPAFTAASTTTVTSPHAVTGLAGNTTYHVRVRAVNANGTGPWSTTDVLTAPGAPGTPSATPGTGSSYSSVSTNWSAPSGGAASYQVQYSTNSAFTGASTATAGSSPKSITGLAGNTTYHVRVRAVNASGVGPWSSATSVLTAPAAVSSLGIVCPEGYDSSGVLRQVNTTTCTVSVGAASGVSVSGTVSGPGGYSQSFTGTSYSAPSVPLANLFIDPMIADARQCNTSGCGPWYGSVARASVPQPGVPTVTNLGCAFGYCQVRLSAAEAWSYEVNLVGGPSTGVIRCLDVQCGDASGLWSVGWDGTRYFSQRDNYTSSTRAFHMIDPCGGQGGCNRELLIPQGTWIRTAGTNGYLNGAIGWPASGWCLPLGSGMEPVLASCNWTTGPGVAEWRGGYIYIS